MSTKIAERILWLAPRHSLIFELSMRSSPFYLAPTVLLSPRGRSLHGDYRTWDFTLAWLRFGITLRRE
jgi:hypothetical protein